MDRTTGLICDQTIMLAAKQSSKEYPDKLRRVKYYDEKTDNTLVFLTNNFTLQALTISKLYKCRWQVELFFKWIKQNLRIKTFYGTSENAVYTQIWIAISIYVLAAIIKKQFNMKITLYTFLQILSVSVFEKAPLIRVVTECDYKSDVDSIDNQLELFS